MMYILTKKMVKSEPAYIIITDKYEPQIIKP